MKKKPFVSSITMLFLVASVHMTKAQGVAEYFASATKASVGPVARFYWYNNELNGIYGLSLSPQLNLLNKFADISISFDLEPVLGYHPGTGADSVSFFYAGSPATLNLNFGHLASKDFRSDMGFFIGGGYSADLIRDSLIFAPVATTGLRWWTYGRSFTLRYHTYFVNQDDYYVAHSLGLFYNFGHWLKHVRKSNKLSRFARPFR